MHKHLKNKILTLLFFLFLLACRPAQPPALPTDLPQISLDVEAIPTVTSTISPSPTVPLVSTETSTAERPTQTVTLTPVPDSTPTLAATDTAAPPTPTVTLTQTAVPPTPTVIVAITPTASSTPSISCDERFPEDGLALITKVYGISEEFEPDDLVSLNEYLPYQNTLGIPMQIREIALEPLLDMVADMEEAGLFAQVVSVYRSAYEQALAYEKWANLYPDRVDQISARPGHSEHQLGTTVDFTSPELPALTGDPTERFHPLFSETSEGIWLAENAHKYGFTLSYPADAHETTGFNFEPWHFRYVGIEIATRLHQIGISYTEFQLINESAPCWPDEE
ncbi:MAG: D-alanyl-D-alanine carboxypeptidase family protein [Chloroflexota bacterium]